MEVLKLMQVEDEKGRNTKLEEPGKPLINAGSVPELILNMIFSGVINVADARLYYSNYTHFQSRRGDIETLYIGKWVASLDNQLYVDDTLNNLLERTSTQPNHSYAFVRHIHMLPFYG